MLASVLLLGLLFQAFYTVVSLKPNQTKDEPCFHLTERHQFPSQLVNFGNVYFVLLNGENDRVLQNLRAVVSNRKSEVNAELGAKGSLDKGKIHPIDENEPVDNKLKDQPSPENNSNDIVAEFTGDSLVIPDGFHITNEQLEWMINEIQNEPENVLVYTAQGSPLSLPVFFSTLSRDQVNRFLRTGFVVFANGQMLPLKCVVSVLSFWRVLVSMSKNDTPLELSASESENVTAYFNYLVYTGDVRIDCPKRKPYNLFEKIISELLVQSQNRLRLLVFGYSIPYKFVKPYLRNDNFVKQ